MSYRTGNSIPSIATRSRAQEPARRSSVSLGSAARQETHTSHTPLTTRPDLSVQREKQYFSKACLSHSQVYFIQEEMMQGGGVGWLDNNIAILCLLHKSKRGPGA